MNRQYSAEGVEKAEHLYCCSGHSLRGVAELTGVPLTTLKRWSGKNGWVEKKSEIGRALIEIRTNTVLLRKRIIESVSIRYHEGTDPAARWFHSGIIPVSFRQHSGAVMVVGKRGQACNMGINLYKYCIPSELQYGKPAPSDFDGKGRLKQITHLADSGTKSFVYNLAGKPDSQTDEDGVGQTYDYNSTYGHLSRITGEDGSYITFGRDPQGNINLQRTWKAGEQEPRRLKKWYYSSGVASYHGLLWADQNADGSSTRYYYTAAGMPYRVYDNEGRLLETTTQQSVMRECKRSGTLIAHQLRKGENTVE